MSTRSILVLCLCGALSFCCFANAPANAWQTETAEADDPALVALAAEATRLQNSGKFPEAANQWEKIVATYPDWSKVGVAWLNLGICQVSMEKFQQAFEPLKKSLQASGTSVDTPKALMFLGYAQMNYGNQLSLSSDEADLKNSSIYLTTATQTLGQIVNRFPEFELSDQALYFRGQSFYKLDRLDDSIVAFQKVAENKKATFRKDAFFDLATAYQRKGEISLADSAYNSFLAVAESTEQSENDPDGLAQASAILRTARGKLGLAAVADDRNDTEKANEIYTEVESLLRPLANDPQSPLRDQAMFNQALAMVGLNDSAKAVDLFEAVARMPKSELSPQASILAGRELSNLKQYDKAIRLLRPFAESDSPFGIEAAILLSASLRMTDQPAAAEKITRRWTDRESVSNSPLLVPLLLEQADATYMIPGEKKQAASLYRKIAIGFPDSSATGDALYKAAAASWETFATDDAVAWTKEFIQRFPQHPRLPAAKAILANAAIADKQFAEGESLYRELISDYPGNPDAGLWTLRIGWTLFLQDKFAESRDFLKGQIDTIARPQEQSEAFHWIGESEFELGSYRDAIGALNQAFESTPAWDRLDATVFTRLQAELKLAQYDDAMESLQLLQTKFPASELTIEALLRTGESYLDREKFTDAITQYKKLITDHPDSKLIPSAMYGLGWAQLRSDQFAVAADTFGELAETFPTTNLAKQALVGRSIAQRRLGKTDTAIADLKEYLKTAPAGERKNNSLLELGLAYVENENWPEAQSTFTELLAIKPKTSLGDRAHYELAWVLKRVEKPDQAVIQFQQLVEQYPNSELAAEAGYEVAAALYEKKDYQAAAKMFESSLAADSNRNSKRSDLEEKSLYQLAWSHYQLKEYDKAARYFSQVASQHPNNERVGDALFMQGQSLFLLDDFAGALKSYQAAKPKLANSSSSKQSQNRLLMLHGSQSANQVGQFETAIELATPLTLIDVVADDKTIKGAESAMVYSAWLEIGKARIAQNQIDGAMDAWGRASRDLGRTGAQARVMKGDLLLEQNRFDDAIQEYKLVFFGYGGTKSEGEIRALQTYAIYETARANYIRVADASERLKPELIAKSLKHFNYLVKNYPDQPLAEKAKQQIEALEKLRQGS